MFKPKKKAEARKLMMAHNTKESFMHLSAPTPSSKQAPEIVTIQQMPPITNCVSVSASPTQITEINDEDIKYCNEFIAFEHHIGGYDLSTKIRKEFAETKE